MLRELHVELHVGIASSSQGDERESEFRTDSKVPCVDHQEGGLRGELTRGDARVRAPPVACCRRASEHVLMRATVEGGDM